MHIRKNDTVLVLAGKDRGKKGRVFRVAPSEDLAWVEGVNQVKKAMRPKPNVRQAGIITIEAPLRLSNLKLVCSACNKPTKVLLRPGPPPETSSATDARSRFTKTRICKICQAAIV